MGMYDDIVYEANCTECGTALKGFQSKDGPCTLETLTPDKVDFFYTYCRKCKTWFDFSVSREYVVTNIEQVRNPVWDLWKD